MRGIIFTASITTLLVTSHALADGDLKPVEYTVKSGDTCPSIAATFFGDIKRIDLVHQLNPQLGPVPHNLRAGQVLLLPPKPTPAPAAPDATLTRVRNKVEVRAPEMRAGKPDDPLFRGNRVGTKESSAADMTFRDETQVKLGENTLVVIFGDTHASATRTNAAEATLVTGSLRARLSEIAGQKAEKPKIATASGSVVMKAGEAKVSVDDKQATRLAVYKGGSTVTAQQRTVPVDDGFGSKAEMGRVPTPPKPLPAAPVWASAPPVFVLTDKDTAEVTGTYAAGQGPGDPAAEWHLQLARDVDFNDVMVDVRAPLATVALAAQKVPPGSYAVRVSAIDADSFEGKWSPVASFAVSRLAIVPLPHRRTRVEAPENALACTVDGAPRALPFEIDRNSDHVLSCTQAAAPASFTLGRLPIARVLATAALVSQGPESGTLRVRVTDENEEPLDGVEVVWLTPSELPKVAGVVVGAFRRSDQEGVYLAPITWKRGTGAKRFSVRVAGSHVAETNAVPLEPEVVASPQNEPSRFEVELGGAGAVRAFTQAGFAGFAGVGIAAPVRAGVAFASLRGVLERYPESTTSAESRGAGTPDARVGATVLGASVPLGYRFGSQGSTLAPYVLIAPQLAVQLVDGPATSTTAVSIGAYGALGLELRAGPGRLFVEAGARGAAAKTPGAPTSAGLLGLGYRFPL